MSKIFHDPGFLIVIAVFLLGALFYAWIERYGVAALYAAGALLLAWPYGRDAQRKGRDL